MVTYRCMLPPKTGGREKENTNTTLSGLRVVRFICFALFFVLFYVLCFVHPCPNVRTHCRIFMTGGHFSRDNECVLGRRGRLITTHTQTGEVGTFASFGVECGVTWGRLRQLSRRFGDGHLAAAAFPHSVTSTALRLLPHYLLHAARAEGAEARPCCLCAGESRLCTYFVAWT